MKNANAQTIHLQRHNGAALITALIILLVLTVLGVTAMRNTSLQENITGNLRDHDLALQAAESALTDAESQLSNAAISGAVPVSGGQLVVGGNPVGTVFAPSDFPGINNTGHDPSVWDGKNNISISTSLGVYTAPSYIIQFESNVGDNLDPTGVKTGHVRSYYRITARGVGKSPNTVVLLQELYGLRR